jgi:single-strand DNA-binding protein
MLNKVILIGRLATDPELKYTPSGIAVTTFRIAVDRPISAEARSQGQEKQADFIDIVAWRQSAEFAANYLNKGRLVAVDGKLQIREYVTQDGQRRRSAEVVADNLKSLDKPREQGEGGEGGGGYAEPQVAAAAAAPAARGGGGGGGGGYAEQTRGGGGGGGYDRAPVPAAGRGAGGAGRGGSRPAPANDAFDDDLSDISDPFAE